MTASTADRKPMKTLTEIRQRHEANGGYWFKPETLKVWKSRVSALVYPCAANGGTYFVSSERDAGLRLFTVRFAAPDGDISNVGKLGQYESRNGAHRAARVCAERGTPAGPGAE